MILPRISIVQLLSLVLLAVSAFAQQPTSQKPAAQQPTHRQAAAQAAEGIPSTGFAGLDQYRASRLAIFTDDFGQLNRYREANATLKAATPGENRVVFFGDSITDSWRLD